MKKLSFYITAVLLLLFVQACKKGLEQVPFVLTTNELTIQLDSSNYTVVTLDTLKINATITESKPEGHAFTYSWQVWPNIGNGEMQEISTQKNLKIKVLLAPTSYRYRFIVKDAVTGISYIKHGFLTVVSPFDEGWLVTHNSNGKGHLGFIRTTDDKVFLTPAEDVNQKTYDEGLGAYAAAWAFNPSYYQMYFITRSGAYRFDSQSFVQITDNSKLFFTGAPENYTAASYYGHDGYGLAQYIFNNGSVYAANPQQSGFSGFTFSEKFSSRLPGDYEAFPFLFKFGSIGTSAAFYDNKNKTFKTIDGTLAVADITTATGLANLGKTMVAADIGPSREYMCVLKDVAGKFYLFSFGGTAPAYASATNKNQEMLNCPDIASATQFTTSRANKTLYYSAGNKVYLYDINANSAKLIYTFPAGYVIKDLEMLKEVYKYLEYSSALHNKRLAVAVDNGTNGEVYYLDLNSVGEVTNNTYSKKFTGFGQITHLNVKSPY